LFILMRDCSIFCYLLLPLPFVLEYVRHLPVDAYIIISVYIVHISLLLMVRFDDDIDVHYSVDGGWFIVDHYWCLLMHIITIPLMILFLHWYAISCCVVTRWCWCLFLLFMIHCWCCYLLLRAVWWYCCWFCCYYFLIWCHCLYSLFQLISLRCDAVLAVMTYCSDYWWCIHCWVFMWWLFYWYLPRCYSVRYFRVLIRWCWFSVVVDDAHLFSAFCSAMPLHRSHIVVVVPHWFFAHDAALFGDTVGVRYCSRRFILFAGIVYRLRLLEITAITTGDAYSVLISVSVDVLIVLMRYAAPRWFAPVCYVLLLIPLRAGVDEWFCNYVDAVRALFLPVVRCCLPIVDGYWCCWHCASLMMVMPLMMVLLIRIVPLVLRLFSRFCCYCVVWYDDRYAVFFLPLETLLFLNLLWWWLRCIVDDPITVTIRFVCTTFLFVRVLLPLLILLFDYLGIGIVVYSDLVISVRAVECQYHVLRIDWWPMPVPFICYFLMGGVLHYIIIVQMVIHWWSVLLLMFVSYSPTQPFGLNGPAGLAMQPLWPWPLFPAAAGLCILPIGPKPGLCVCVASCLHCTHWLFILFWD